MCDVHPVYYVLLSEITYKSRKYVSTPPIKSSVPTKVTVPLVLRQGLKNTPQRRLSYIFYCDNRKLKVQRKPINVLTNDYCKPLIFSIVHCCSLKKTLRGK